jgi:cytochrome c peroxidase
MSIRQLNSSKAAHRAATVLLGMSLPAVMFVTTQQSLAQDGEVLQTPNVPMELPLELEIEVSPAGSLKQAATWKEFAELLEHPGAYYCLKAGDPASCFATIERRPSFRDAKMPDLAIWPLDYNFLTGQPMRLQNLLDPDSGEFIGEVSLDQPGPVFDPDEDDEDGFLDEFSTPTELRGVIGEIIPCPLDPDGTGPKPGYGAGPGRSTLARSYLTATCRNKPIGSLVVSNPSNTGAQTRRATLGYTGTVADPRIPPDGTIVAIPVDVDDITSGVEELEIPINENDFFREEDDAHEDLLSVDDDMDDVEDELREYVGRAGAEVLGKAFFWDMQVGSDGVQACGSCHFHAGADNRTRNQINPNTLGGDGEKINIRSVNGSATTNVEVVASDFPFRLLADKNGPSQVPTGFDAAGRETGWTDMHIADTNDVLSSMGVSRFAQFVDIPAIGEFTEPVNGVAALPPDIGKPLDENSAPGGVPVMDGVRRVEPRNTPTFHGAAFNFDNFWDGRARFAFNGGSVFGASDPQHHVFWDDGDGLDEAENGDVNPELEHDEETQELAEQPVRIKFSSLASQSVGPPLSEFEMSFLGRSHPKLGKKLLQAGVTPLANQLVDKSDSVLGPFSNQGGSLCAKLEEEKRLSVQTSEPPKPPPADGKPGLCLSYPELIKLAFREELWENDEEHLEGAYDSSDPFDSYSLEIEAGPADPKDTNEFTQMEANFSLFFGLSIQAYETLTIPDHTLLDQFFDLNPNAGEAVGEPGDQAVLFPTLIPQFVRDTLPCPAPNTESGVLCLPPGFGPDEVFGFDVFAGANLTAALAPNAMGAAGKNRNPTHTITTEAGLRKNVNVGANPFTRSAKCMLCHLGPEQTDHSINIAHGILKGDAEFEYPNPPTLPDPTSPPTFLDGAVPAPEPSGSTRSVTGLILAEEVSEGAAQDAVEVEPRDFATFDNPETPWDDRVVAQHRSFAFGDQGIYNIGLRPIDEDLGRGGKDPFGWPLSLSAMTLINIAGDGMGNPATPANAFVPCKGPVGDCVMGNIEADELEEAFEERGDEGVFPTPGSMTTPGTHELTSINPGLERAPITPLLPEYMVPWAHDLPAGELHPAIDEIAGMVPNTTTPPNGGPGIEFPEIIFGADLHCALYEPLSFGLSPPNFGWGPPDDPSRRICPNNQSGTPGNLDFPAQGTWPTPNRVLADGAFKAPALRNVEMTGPYFHTGSMATLRQVVDFYFRGGDFPIQNAAHRDPHIANLNLQAFAFGPTDQEILNELIDFPEMSLFGYFSDGLPDTVYRYGLYPDTDHGLSPEPADATGEDVKDSLVRIMLAMTDPRVKHERAPFDRPEIFVPIDGRAPENSTGRKGLLAMSGKPCPDTSGPNPGPVCFRQIPAVGAGGGAALPNFLGVSSVKGPGLDHFDP